MSCSSARRVSISHEPATVTSKEERQARTTCSGWIWQGEGGVDRRAGIGATTCSDREEGIASPELDIRQ